MIFKKFKTGLQGKFVPVYQLLLTITLFIDYGSVVSSIKESFTLISVEADSLISHYQEIRARQVWFLQLTASHKAWLPGLVLAIEWSFLSSPPCQKQVLWLYLSILTSCHISSQALFLSDCILSSISHRTNSYEVSLLKSTVTCKIYSMWRLCKVL